MTVLDASIVVGGLLDPTSPVFKDLVQDRVARMSTINVAEVVDVLIRKHGSNEQDVIDGIGLLIQAGLSIEPLSARQALAAGALRSRYFDRRTRSVSMADCVAVSLAAEAGEPVVSSDRALLAMATAEGIAVVEIAPFGS